MVRLDYIIYGRLCNQPEIERPVGGQLDIESTIFFRKQLDPGDATSGPHGLRGLSFELLAFVQFG